MNTQNRLRILKPGEEKFFQLSSVVTGGGKLVADETQYSEIFRTYINKLIFSYIQSIYL